MARPHPDRPYERGRAAEHEAPTRLARALPGFRGVRVHVRDGVTVLFVSGPVDGPAADLDRAATLCLSDEPRAVVCDLTDVEGAAGTATLGALANLSTLAHEWPGTPLVVVAATPLRTQVAHDPACHDLVLFASLHEALSEALRRPVPVTANRALPPHPTAARAARDFLTECVLDWKVPKALAAGSLVMSELVTNAMVYAHSDIGVSVSRHGSLVRIAVRDADRGIPTQRSPDLDSPGGRGLVLVDGFARAWGVLPAPHGGKVVWAVVEG